MLRSAPTAQLAAVTGPAISELSSRIRDSNELVGFLKKSTLTLSALQLLKVGKHRLIQSCMANWNSVYEMCHRLDEQKQFINAVLSDKIIATAHREETVVKLPANGTGYRQFYSS